MLFHLRSLPEAVGLNDKLKDMAFTCQPIQATHHSHVLLVETASIQEVTTHMLRMDVKLKDPLNFTLIGHIYRRRGSKVPWKPEEIATLRELYSTADRVDILRALPHRSWDGCVCQAKEMRLQRTTTLNTSGIHYQVTYADAMLICSLEAVERLGWEKDFAVWAIDDAAIVDLYRRLQSPDCQEQVTLSAYKYARNPLW